MLMRYSLAWLQLTHEKIRFIIALAGITFADVLMFMQLGFRDALFDSAVRLHKSLEGDIFLLSSETDSIVEHRNFSLRHLYGLVAIKEVKAVTPIYTNVAGWKNPVKRNTRGILILGINPAHNPITFPGVGENLKAIKQQDVVLFDRLSRSEFGPITQQFQQGQTVKTEVANRRIKVGGLFAMGTSFGADGNLITSDVNFFRLFPERKKGEINIGVVQLEPGSHQDLVLQKIRKNFLGDDVIAFSKQELIDHEKNYWNTRTTIGFVFAFGTVIGFIVGTVIVYQILYTDVTDHLPEYATLKAMGYTDSYLLIVVFQEAIILACVGYLPGLSLSLFLYFNTAKATGLPIAMTLARGIQILILTVMMCCISGGIAVGKLRAADPADIF